MFYHEKILLSDALREAIEVRRLNIRLKRIIALETVLCVLMGIILIGVCLWG